MQQVKSKCVAHFIWKGKALGWKENRGVPENLVRILDVANVEYTLVSVEKDPGAAEHVATRGFTHNGVAWRLADAVVRAKNGFLGVFVRADGPVTGSMDGFRRSLGLCADLKSALDVQKAQKLLGRCYAPHERIAVADILSDAGEVVTFKMRDNGYIGRVRIHPQGYGAFSDGMMLYRRMFANLLGYEGKGGDGLRSTIWTPRGIFKGHGVVKEDLMFDMVLYDGKSLLKSCDGTLKFGVMSKLHAGHRVMSDFQSFNNFRRIGEFPGRVEQVLMGLRDGLRDEAEMKSMLQGLHQRFADQVAAGEKSWDDAWSLLYWLEQGLPVCSTPVMRRKVVSMVNGTLMDIERWRVPLDESSVYRYVMSDIFAFDNFGDFHRNRGVLRGRECFIPGLVFDEKYRMVAGHRQPNTTPREKWFYLATNNLAYHCLVGSDSPFYFVSNDCLEESLSFLGGGDLDDQVELHTDVETVDAYVHVDDREYPCELAASGAAVEPRRNRFDDRRFEYGAREMHEAIYRVMGTGGRSLGSDMNRIMADTNGWNEGLWEKPFLSYSASNGEQLIDQSVNVAKSGGFDVKRSENEFKAFAREVKVCSQTVFHRLPASHRERVTPVRTKTDVDYDKALELRQEFLDHQIQEQWDQLGVPEALRLVDSSLFRGDAREIQAFAKAKRQEMLPKFRDEVVAEFEADGVKVSGDAVVGAVQAKANARACHAAQEAVFVRFGNRPNLLDIWATLMKIVWVEEVSPDSPYGVSDWILGGKDTVRWTADCYKKLRDESAGLTVLIRDVSIEIAERQVRRIEVTPSVDVVYCHDYWQSRGFAEDSPEVTEFRSRVGRTVEIRVAKRGRYDQGEALLDGQHFGWLRGGDEKLLDGRTSGTLVLAEGSPFGMLIKLDAVPGPEEGPAAADEVVCADEIACVEPVTPAPEHPSQFVVVNGWERKKDECRSEADIADWHEDLFDWHELAGTKGTLRYCPFDGKDAVEVVNYRGERHGWVTLGSKHGEQTVSDFVRFYGKERAVTVLLKPLNAYCMAAHVDSRPEVVQ